MSAFETALNHGCDGFEFDVRLTRDDQAIVCHDARSRGRSIAGTDAARLPHLPVFHDVIARFAWEAFLNIELKVAGLEQHVLSALFDRPPERGYVVSSFLPELLIALRARSETIPLGIVFDRRHPRWKRHPQWNDLPVNYAIPHHSLVTPKLVDQIHDAGKYIMTWTINNKRSMLRLANWGVDGIISDKTELLVRTLRPPDR